MIDLKKLGILLLLAVTNVLLGQAPIPIKVPLGDLIGINTRPSDPINTLRKFNHIRSFHTWGNEVGLAPSTTAECPNTVVGPTKLWYNYQNSNNPGVNMDNFYGAISNRSVATLKDIAPIMRGLNAFHEETPFEQKPFCLNMPYTWNWQTDPLAMSNTNSFGDHDKPATYLEHAINMSLFTARFGKKYFQPYSPMHCFIQHAVEPNNCVGTALFPCKPDPVVTGLRTVEYVECYNEPEKTWRDDMTNILNDETWFYMSPSQYAALVSADYDGDCESAEFLLPFCTSEKLAYLGVKNIDPEMKFALGGLWNWHGTYVEEMIDWFQANRTEAKGCPDILPFDVVNLHHYSTVKSEESSASFETKQYTDYIDFSAAWGGGGLPPEDDNVKNRLKSFRTKLFAKANEIETKEFWFSEFGYDTNPNWQTSVPTCASVDAQTTQAQWLTRYILAISASRSIHRADMFELRDNINGANFTYSSSGLVNRNFTPKRSFYHIMTLKNVLGDYLYEGDGSDITNEPNDVLAINKPAGTKMPYVYKFIKGDEVVYAIWSPEHCNQSYTGDITFNVPVGQLPIASLIQVKEWEEYGFWTDWSSNLDKNTNTLKVNNLPISGTPIYLVMGTAKNSVVPISINTPTVTGFCCEDVQLSWSKPVNSTISHYRIYYKLGGGTTLDFQDPELLLYTDNLAGNLTSTMISGLIAGGDYVFWVVPVSDEGHIPNGPILGTSFTVSGCTPGGLSPCLLPILGMGTVTYGNAVSMANQVFSTANGCGDLSSDNFPFWTDWNWGTNNPLDTRVEIELFSPIVIKQGYYFDGEGDDPIIIEYKDCCAKDDDDWRLLSVLDGTRHREWRNFSAAAVNPIKYLRIYKSSDQAKVGKILFCGETTTCDKIEIIEDLPNSEEIRVQINRIGESDAEISWNPVQINREHPELGNYNMYLIQYASNTFEDGTLVNPSERYVYIDPRDASPYVRLEGLESDKEYHATLTVARSIPHVVITSLCGERFTPIAFNFHTKGGIEDRSESAKKQVSNEFSISPNPTTDGCWVKFEALGYNKIAIVEASTGRIVGQQDLNPLVYNSYVSMVDLRNGVYILHAKGENRRAISAQVIRIKE